MKQLIYWEKGHLPRELKYCVLVNLVNYNLSSGYLCSQTHWGQSRTELTWEVDMSRE